VPNKFGLTRYWFEFELPPYPPHDGIRLDGDEWWKPIRRLTYGVGVTGWDQRDCLGMISRHLLDGDDPPPLKTAVVDVDVRRLEQEHVVRNMGDCAVRGIWYPALRLDPRRA